MTKIQYLKSILEKIEEKQTELFIRRTSLPIDEYCQQATLLDEYYKEIKTELEIQQIILLQSPDTYKNEITSDDEFQIQTLRRLKIKEEELFKKWTSNEISENDYKEQLSNISCTIYEVAQDLSNTYGISSNLLRTVPLFITDILTGETETLPIDERYLKTIKKENKK